MEAGELRDRISIERAKTTRNDAGEGVTTWELLAKVYAAIRPASSKEVMLMQAVESQISHTITIRYHSEVSSSCRITFGTRTFNISGVVDVDERRREMRLFCFETGGTR